MITLLLLFALNVATPGEMLCTGSVKESTVSTDVFVAGVEQEGLMTLATEGQLLYLNGPKVSGLKPGSVQQVVRPEGKIKDPNTGISKGFYYLDIGTIRIEVVDQDRAVARILNSCREMVKGDFVIPYSERPAVKFDGSFANDLTPLPKDGLVGAIVLGKDDTKELAAGNMCFIGLGKSDGVRAGDRFTVFRPYPAFNANDMGALDPGSDRSYASMRGTTFHYTMESLLRSRKLPPQVLGDIIVLEAGDGVSTGKIVNSLSVIHLGDFIVKR